MHEKILSTLNNLGARAVGTSIASVVYVLTLIAFTDYLNTAPTSQTTATIGIVGLAVVCVLSIGLALAWRRVDAPRQ